MAEEKKNRDLGQRGRTYVYEGKTYTLNSLCNAVGYKYQAVWKRLQKGMTIEEAFNECACDPKTWQGISCR